jgi:hypothetical protein
VAFEVPKKKWVESAVREILVTDPITFYSLLIAISLNPNFATVPSPAPTKMSPFARRATQLMP